MNHRVATVLAEQAITSAKTEVIDLDMADIISRIQINVEVEMPGDVLGAHPASVLSNIEIVDGSDVLFSLSGKEAQALDFYQTGVMPLNAITDRDGNDCIMVFNINFGRYLYDEMLAFDPNKFRNPQIKITHNYAACGGTPSDARMEVRAYLFDEKVPTPTGFIMSKEHYQYTCSTNGTYEYIDMPTDHLTRRFMILGTAGGYFCQQVVNEIRLSEDNAKRIPYDTTVWQLLKMLHQMYPRIEEYGHFLFSDTAKVIYASPTQDIVVNAVGVTAGNIACPTVVPTKMPVSLDAVYPEGGNAQISGNDPHYAFILPCGRPNDPEDWYDVTKLGNLKMRLKAGSAGESGVVEVVTEQLRNYA